MLQLVHLFVNIKNYNRTKFNISLVKCNRNGAWLLFTQNANCSQGYKLTVLLPYLSQTLPQNPELSIIPPNTIYNETQHEMLYECCHHHQHQQHHHIIITDEYD